MLRNPDQLDVIFFPKLIKLQQLRGKGLAPWAWGGVQLRALEKLPKALGNLLPLPCAPVPRMSVLPLLPQLPHTMPKRCGSVVNPGWFQFLSCNLAKEEVVLGGKGWG